MRLATSIAAAAALCAAAGLTILPAPAAEARMQQQAQPTLNLGDDAPALEIATFVKGEEVTSFEKGRVYVIEFWATWCGPCIKAFPHLSELQAQYEDKMTVIGVNIWERMPESQREQTIRDFVDDQGDKMAYTVAIEKGAAMAENWMRAAGRNGIPSAFIVDQQGKIAWMGHPMEMDQPLEQILAGEWDVEKAGSALAVQKQAETLMMAANEAYQGGDMETVLAKLDEIVALDPETFAQAAMGKFQIIAMQMNDYPAAYGYLRGLLDGHYSDSPDILNNLAFFILTDGSLAQRDTQLAADMAERAAEATNHNDADVLDTLGMARDANGNTAGAIEAASKAVELATDDAERASYQANLETYQAKAAG